MKNLGQGYVRKQNKKLRCGYTTGSCAAGAAKAAAFMLVTGEELTQISIMTPAGIELTLTIEQIQKTEQSVSCAIRKDAGDDPDVTHGILIFATVSLLQGADSIIDGGEGVGRVTRKGLEQPVGDAAINKIPRQMIYEETDKVRREFGIKQGFHVIITVPEGEILAHKTFNKRLGVIGGISIIGTSGIVVPMSERALLDSIRAEMQMHVNNEEEYLIIAPGNYGQAFSMEQLHLNSEEIILCSNFIGETIDMAMELEVKGFLLIAHLGKIVKVAAGIMNTHSGNGDARMEILASHAAQCGASIELVRKILECVTTDEVVEHLLEENLCETVMESLLIKIDYYCSKRAGGELLMGFIIFSNAYGLLGKSREVLGILKKAGKATSTLWHTEK